MWNDQKNIGMQILGFYGYDGFTPGGFLTSLLSAWEKADMENRFRLTEGFPELAAALDVFQRMNPIDYREWLLQD